MKLLGRKNEDLHIKIFLAERSFNFTLSDLYLTKLIKISTSNVSYWFFPLDWEILRVGSLVSSTSSFGTIKRDALNGPWADACSLFTYSALPFAVAFSWWTRIQARALGKAAAADFFFGVGGIKGFCSVLSVDICRWRVPVWEEVWLMLAWSFSLINKVHRRAERAGAIPGLFN